MGGVVADSHLRHAFAARKRTEIFRVNKKDRKNTKQMFFMLGGKALAESARSASKSETRFSVSS